MPNLNVGFLAVPAQASLQVSTTSALGTKCYSEDTAASVMRVMRSTSKWVYDGGVSFLSCPSSRSAVSSSGYMSATSCFLGYDGTTTIICSDATSACGGFGYSDGDLVDWGTWKNTTQNRASNIKTVLQTTSTYTCAEVEEVESYGCAAGYYTTASTPSASMTCTACPPSGDNAQTTSDIGNTSVSGCYIPKNSSFSDSSGSGVYSGKCNY